MDYEKKYKEALEKARQLCAYPTTKPFISDLQNLFPELKESEDERISKEIIKYLEQSVPHHHHDEILKSKEWIAWLEKHGGNLVENGYTNNKDFIKYADNYSHEIWHKLMDNFKNIKDYHIGCNDVSDIVLNAIIDTCNWLEKQGEQKSDDKVEPRFKVGDWITNGKFIVGQITSIGKEYYHYICNGIEQPLYIPNAHKYHLWTIQDARPGDILSNGDYIVIFKDNNYNTETKYGCMCVYCSVIGYNEYWYDYNGINPTDFAPATNKQREYLFKRMYDAGYEWDAKKLELRKINSTLEEKDNIDNGFTEFMLKEDQRKKLNSEARLNKISQYLRVKGYEDDADWLQSLKLQNSQWKHVYNDVYVKEPTLAQKKDKSDKFNGYVLCADHTMNPEIYERYCEIDSFTQN